MAKKAGLDTNEEHQLDDADLAELIEWGAKHHYEDAVLYDYEYRRRSKDVRFYTEVANRIIPNRDRLILELACGSGRVTTGLLRAGHQVLALDASAAMLERATDRARKMGRAHRQRLRLVRADMRQFHLGIKTALVISAFNSFEHLYTRADVESCLAAIRNALDEGGTLAFDVQNPDLEWLIRDPEKRWAKTTFIHPINRKKIVYSTNHFYDPVTQICMIRIFYKPVSGGEEKVIHLSQRKFFPAEIEALLWANGFRVVARYGDFDSEPLHGDAESQVLVARTC